MEFVGRELEGIASSLSSSEVRDLLDIIFRVFREMNLRGIRASARVTGGQLHQLKPVSCGSLNVGFFFASRRRNTSSTRDWISDGYSSELGTLFPPVRMAAAMDQSGHSGGLPRSSRML